MQKFIHSLLLLGVLLAAGCSYQKRHMAKADKYFAAGDYDNAEIEYLNVLHRAPSFQGYKRLGIIYLADGRIPLAAAVLMRAYGINTNDLEIRASLAKIYLSVGDAKRARDEIRFVLDRQPDNPEAPIVLSDTVTSAADAETIRSYLEKLSTPEPKRAAVEVALGNLSLREKDLRAAQKHYGNARNLDPKMAAIYAGVGNWYWIQNDNKLADDAFKKAFDLAPPRSPIRLRYAQFKIRTGDLAGAREVLASTIKAAPDYLPAHMALAQLALGQKKYDEAAGEIDQILAKDSRDFEALMLRGRVANYRGDYPLAITTFRKLTDLFPKNPEIYYQLAVAQRGNNELDPAITSLKKVLALQPTSSDAVLLLDDIMIRQGRGGIAIPSLKQFAREQPTNTPPQYMLAAALDQQGDLNAAISVYDELAKQLPDDARLFWLKGNLLARENKYGPARAAFEKSLALEPNSQFPLEQLVDIDLEQKHYSNALELIQSHLDKYPTNQSPRILMARVYLVQGQTNQAEAALEKAIELQPELTAAALSLGQIYHDDGQFAKAAAVLKKMTVQEPQNVLAWMRLGIAQTALNDFTGARDSYLKVLAINPKFSAALNNLAYIYSEKLGDLDQAFKTATLLRNMVPPEPSTAPYAADTLGWVLYKQGDYGHAMPLLEEAVAALGSDPEVLYHLAMANYMNGQEATAKTILQRVAATPGDFPARDQVPAYLAILAINPQTAGAAEKSLLEKRLDSQPNDLGALTRLAAIYQHEGSAEKAIKNYEMVLRLNSRNINALVHLAELYSRKDGDVSKALDYANQAYSLLPDSLEVADVLGKVAYRAGSYKRALGALEQASIQHPDNAELLYDLALARYSIGQVAGAQTSLQNALQAEPSFPHATDAKQLLDMITLATEPAAMVSPQITQILAKDPDNVPALMIVAGSQQKTDVKAARATYEKILKHFPTFTPAEKRLALIYAEEPSSDDAAYQIGIDARTAYPNDPEVARAMGIFAYRHGDYTRAKPLLRESAATRSDDAKTFYYLGMTQYRLKETIESKKNLRHALELHLPDYAAKEANAALAEMK